jgi:hypothetical protein
MDSSAISNSIAALRSSIKHLASCSDSLRPWLHFFVTLVVIGVVLEVVFVFWEYRAGCKEYRRGTIRSPQQPSAWKLFLELFGVGLVAIGVAGELGVDIKSDAIQTKLRGKNGELIQLLEDVAGSALTNASQNEKDAQLLKKQVEDEKLARVELEARVAWRRLTRQQQCEIASRLMQIFSGGTATLFNVNADAEGMMFASDIASALRMAHWTVKGPTPYFFPNGPTYSVPMGLEINGDLAVNVLVQKLKSFGFTIDNKLPPEKIPRTLRPKITGGLGIFVNHRREDPEGNGKLR